MPYFWKQIWLAPQLLIPVIVTLLARAFWLRGVRLKKYEGMANWRRILIAAGLTYGLFMAAFFVTEAYTSPPVNAAGHGYTLHLRQWAITGMCLSVAGILISLFGRGTTRALMTLLMLACFGWWWFAWSVSFITF